MWELTETSRTSHLPPYAEVIVTTRHTLVLRQRQIPNNIGNILTFLPFAAKRGKQRHQDINVDMLGKYIDNKQLQLLSSAMIFDNT